MSYSVRPIARPISGIEVPSWAVAGARGMMFVGMMSAVAVIALTLVDVLAYGWSRFLVGVEYCAAPPPPLELHGRCDSTVCLEARAALIYDGRQVAIDYQVRCMTDP